uniref:piggyBac transposable element-derived protein 4-like n=1 Tax=Styela clava TaxID=7725 RepID=UPI001939AF82|nr:piggyBac transposable element-derived protein 4-like [Styela clava]
MAVQQDTVLNNQDVLWEIENEEFIPDSDSDYDDFDGSDISDEDESSWSGTDDEQDSKWSPNTTTTSTSPPPIRRRRTSHESQETPTTPKSRKRYRPSTPKSRKTYNWEKSFAGRSLWNFCGRRGVSSRRLNSSSSVLDCFTQFFNATVIELIVEMTNLNATRKLHAESVNSDTEEKAWKAIDAEEMHAFLGLVILMGIIRLPTLDMYWQKKNWILDVPSFNKTMTRQRFRDIWRYLHFCDEAMAPEAEDFKKDKLYKIRALLTILLPLFQTCYTPGREISIDETLIPFKGRISFRQCIKTKRARFGIKVWVLAESATGYVSRLQFYTGKDPTSKPEIGLSSRVVRYLIEPYQGLYHHLYVDNFYTNPELFEYLLSKGVYACGTYRSNRTNFPTKLTISKIGSVPRGTNDWRVSGQLLAQSWVDNKVVYFLSTIHKPEYDKEYVGRKTVKRRAGRRRESRFVEIPCPPLLKDYNAHMGGVDLSDQMRKYYNLTRRSKIWYRRVFSYLLEVAIHNARVICENLSGKRCSAVGFREELVASLIGSYRASRRISESLSSSSHHPRLMNVGQHIPLVERNQVVCPVCSRKSKLKNSEEKTYVSRSRVKCLECGVHLCMTYGKTCFRDWHTKIEYWR